MQNEIVQLMNNLSAIFKSFHNKSYHKMENKNMYPGQPKLLGLIKNHEGITQKDLSEKCFVTPATITGMLNKLEANNYVYRVTDEADKRIMRVYLTPEGRDFAEKGEQFIEKILGQIFDGFTEEELHTLIILSEKMKANVYRHEK